MTVTWHDRLPSTMDAAHRLAEQGAPHGTAVAAREQTAGRGRRGRAWDSARGGLWLSVIGRPAVATGMEHLSLRVGLALAEALEREAGGRFRIAIKRPNDLLVAGRKLAGILCEARWEGPVPAWVVVGLGLNVANPLPPDLPATSLAALGIEASVDTLAGPVARAMAEATLVAGPLSADEEGRIAAREAPR